MPRTDDPIAVLGSDGYTGWTLTCHLLDNGYDVAGVDDFTRRVTAEPSVTPLADHNTRTTVANTEFGGEYHFTELDITDYDALEAWLDRESPGSIVNLAQIPAAPYSMISPDHAWETQQNNIQGALNIIWALRNLNQRDTHIVQLATMGEYGIYPEGTRIPEGFLDDGRPAPKSPGSLYHASKVNATVNTRFCADTWDIPVTEIYQGIVFGLPEFDDDRLLTRYDVDACVPPGSEVYTDFGIKEIEDIGEGDQVLTHKGRFRAVTDTFERDFAGELVEIDIRYLDETLQLTPNHPLLMVEKDRKVVDGQNEYSYSEPTWISAGELVTYAAQPASDQADLKEKHRRAMKLYNEGQTYADIAERVDAKYSTVWSWINRGQVPPDCKREKRRDLYLVKPIPDQIEDVESIDVQEYTGYGVREGDTLYAPNPANSERAWGEGIPAELPLDEHFLKFAGYYLAEGSCQEYQVTLSFGKDETKIVDHAEGSLDKLLDGRPIERVSQESKETLRVSSKAFAKLIHKLFGDGASSKRLPKFFLHLPTDKQRVLIRAYWEGDGWEDKAIDQFGFSSASKIFMRQLQLVLLRLGIISGTQDRVREQVLDFDGRETYSLVSEQTQLAISGPAARSFANTILGRDTTDPEKPRHFAKWVDGRCLIPINRIEVRPYVGKVYNLEVEEDHSYTVRGQAVHNCWGTVLNRFTAQAAIGEPLTVYGRGGQKRAMLSIDDCIQCLTLALENPPGPRVPGDHPYRAINQFDEAYRVKELADMVQSHTGAEIMHLENPREEDDGEHFYEPERAILDQLGNEPSCSIEAVFERTYAIVERFGDRVPVDELMPDVYWDDRKNAEPIAGNPTDD